MDKNQAQQLIDALTIIGAICSQHHECAQCPLSDGNACILGNVSEGSVGGSIWFKICELQKQIDQENNSDQDRILKWSDLTESEQNQIRNDVYNDAFDKADNSDDDRDFFDLIIDDEKSFQQLLEDGEYNRDANGSIEKV